MDDLIKKFVQGLKRQEMPDSDFSQSEPLSKDLQKIWDLSSNYRQQGYEPDLEHNLSRFKQRLDAEKTKRRSRRGIRYFLVRAAALMVIGLGLIWLLRPNLQAPPPALTVVETTNLTKEVQLPDGTQVTLFENSTLEYPEALESTSIREVSMTGKAFFSVTASNARPFIIHTHATRTRVVGTRFTLDATPGKDQTTIAVEEGKVAFTDKETDQTLMLTANQMGICRSGGILFQQALDPVLQDESSTITKARNMKIQMLADKLEQKQGWNIQVHQQTADCRVSADFDLSKGREVLEKLQKLGYAIQETNATNFTISGTCPN